MENSVTTSRRKHEERQSASCKNDDGVVVVASITDVPDQILMEICSNLSVKSICRFRSVCKHLFNLLTSPDFIQLHFRRAPVCPLICRAPLEWSYLDGRSFSKSLSLFEFRRDRIFSAGSSNLLNLTDFKIPRRSLGSYGLKGFNVVNSCNGYICLEVKLKSGTIVAIYNPVTCEYSLLPFPKIATKKDQVFVSGLGYCPNSNQYKVLIFLGGQAPCRTCRGNQWFSCSDKVALIYTLGLEGGGWRKIECPPCFKFPPILNPVFLNGALHWLVRILKISVSSISRIVNGIISFNLESERFHILPEPPCLNSTWSPGGMTLAGRRGRLYLWYTDSLDSGLIFMWVMNDNGVEKSWTRDVDVVDVKDDGELWSLGLNPISDFSNNWDLLLYLPRKKSIYLIDKHHDCIRSLKISKAPFGLKVFAHVPSFISLKNVVGDSLEVVKF